MGTKRSRGRGEGAAAGRACRAGRGGRAEGLRGAGSTKRGWGQPCSWGRAISGAEAWPSHGVRTPSVLCHPCPPCPRSRGRPRGTQGMQPEWGRPGRGLQACGSRGQKPASGHRSPVAHRGLRTSVPALAGGSRAASQKQREEQAAKGIPRESRSLQFGKRLRHRPRDVPRPVCAAGTPRGLRGGRPGMRCPRRDAEELGARRHPGTCRRCFPGHRAGEAASAWRAALRAQGTSGEFGSWVRFCEHRGCGRCKACGRWRRRRR